MSRGTNNIMHSDFYSSNQDLDFSPKNTRSKTPNMVLDTEPKSQDIFHIVDGFYHREDGPAIERADGFKEWRLKGKLHRVDGPASLSPNGKYEIWALNGKYHREYYPAISTSDNPPGYWQKEWWLDGECHASIGPDESIWYINQLIVPEDQLAFVFDEVFMGENML